MKQIIFSMLLAMTQTFFAKIWTITDVGFTFSPATITITVGDSVNFNIISMHDAVEVNQTTWSANGTTPLPGFSVPFGGGMVLPAQLNAGTHYYVCTAHASSGMKGIIIVQNVSGIFENKLQKDISIYPNPSNGKFHVASGNEQFPTNKEWEIYNPLGELVYLVQSGDVKNDIDLSSLGTGIYFIKIPFGQATLTKKIVIQ